MPTDVSTGESKDLTLDQLNAKSAQSEAVLGPLKAIGNDGQQTILTFDTTRDPPNPASVIKRAPGAPAGAVQGKVFVEGALTDCYV